MLSRLRFGLVLGFWLLLSSFDLPEGIKYTNIVTMEPQSIHVLEIKPENVEIFSVSSLDDGLGRETVRSMACRYAAIAAINGGFFKIGGNFDGVSMGVLNADGHWYSLPSKSRAVIGWNDDTKEILIDQLLSECSVKIKDKKIYVDVFNKPRQPEELALYSYDFHKTTLTNYDTFEVLIENGKVIGIREQGSSEIPKNGYVLSLPTDRVKDFLPIDVNDDVKVDIMLIPRHTNSENWYMMKNLVGGTPVLIRNGERILDYSPEQITIETFITEKHARTAIGILPNGNWLFVVVDGKQPELSLGMTLEELSIFMEERGCVEAINMDGGGSATMVIEDKVVNNPYGDEDEDGNQAKSRRVSDAILMKVK